MTNEKPPAPEEAEKYLFNLARVRKNELDYKIEAGRLKREEHYRDLSECEVKTAALEREAFVLAKWIQDQ